MKGYVLLITLHADPAMPPPVIMSGVEHILT